MDKAKALLLIADGLGDRPIKELGDKTPLEVAEKPNLDKLATEGECGIMDPIAPGVRAGSDTSHLAILGYDPFKYYTGRGPFEAAGIGMDVRKGDIAFRCNFSTVDDNMVVTDRRAGRITSGTDQLAAAVNGLDLDGVEVIFKESVAHRGALILRAPGLGAEITDTDPHHEGAKVLTSQAIDPNDAASAKTAKAVNDFVAKSYELLKDHPVNKERIAQGLNPANIILPAGRRHRPEHRELRGRAWPQGRVRGRDRPDQRRRPLRRHGHHRGPRRDRRPGLRSYEHGQEPSSSSSRHTISCCATSRAPTWAGTTTTPRRRSTSIAKLDEMVGYLMANVPAHTYIVLTADHSTPCAVMDHSGDPVPIAFWGEGVRTDAVKHFRRAFGDRRRHPQDSRHRRLQDHHAAYERAGEVRRVAFAPVIPANAGIHLDSAPAGMT